ncbi:unnamed protein product [Prorocentrum cordatum]|uniref:Calmodulin-lysine N-methyltransferase n=1 Tax=Prorocentrum cordatum TaxID=2364126 RepID=A0ABN9S6Y9_9DINO|nr:unnamed protein product [Polarella glacialis]
MGLELLLRVVPARSEKRLVALLAESFSGVPSVEQDADALASELWLDGLLYAAPLRGEPFISFERPPLPTPLVIRQDESAKDRLGTSEDATGGLVWPSAHALSAHLCARPELVRGRRVVELGAGTGLVGLVAAALGAEEVVLTDLPSALPLLQDPPECDAERQRLWRPRAHGDAQLGRRRGGGCAAEPRWPLPRGHRVRDRVSARRGHVCGPGRDDVAACGGRRYLPLRVRVSRRSVGRL